MPIFDGKISLTEIVQGHNLPLLTRICTGICVSSKVEQNFFTDFKDSRSRCMKITEIVKTRSLLNVVELNPITFFSRAHKLLPLTKNLFLLIMSRLRDHQESYQYKFFRGSRCGYFLSLHQI